MNLDTSTSNHGDHLTLVLFFTLLLHAFIILGIKFSQEDVTQTARHTMNITLVHQRSEQEQDDAKVLAQANQDGGNESESEQASTSPSTSLVHPPTPSVNQQLPQENAPARSEQKTKIIAVKKESGTVPEKAPEELVVEEKFEINAEQLMVLSLAMASSSKIDQFQEAQSSGPRRRLITTKTKEFRDAAYFESWRKKIEKIGNLNYPEEARRRNLSGRLRLDVGLFADGSIESITVVKSSGKKLLDDAAIRIVKLAAPFSSFPDNMLGDTDILVISRVWEFGGAGGFSSR
ncbi:MAG: hypothetical protein COC05_06610 [Gammaproteobacteria bacterium]|nr:MAG: hypothetical protein COC05_06610 [Gammaproteobacteria bacterium]